MPDGSWSRAAWVAAGLVLFAAIAGGIAWMDARAKAAEAERFPVGNYAYVEADASGRLFQPALANAAPTRSTAIPGHPIRISRDAARRAVATGRLPVVLPDNTRYDVDVEREQRESTGDWTLVGRVSTPFGELASVMTFGPDGVFGTLPAPDGRLFHVTTSHGISTIAPAGGILPPGVAADEPDARDYAVPPAPGTDPSGTPRLSAPWRPEPGVAHHAGAPERAGAAPASEAATSQAATAELTTLDLLGLYTSDLVTLRGSVSAAETEYANQVAITNQAHIDTGTHVRFRLVGLRETALPTDVGNEQALSLITEGSLPDGLDSVALRDELLADLVALLRPYQEGSATCGIAWLNGASLHPEWALADYGFSVSSIGPSCTPYVLAHETGHNLGSSHDIEAAGWTNVQYGAFPFSFGFRQGGAGGFATVMAYSQGETLIGRFSDPTARVCGGVQRCGGVAADNRRSLDYMAANAAAFRLPPGQLSIADASTIEGHAELPFQVSLSSPAPAGGVSFRIETLDGSTTAGEDYAGTVREVTIPQGEKTAAFTVALHDDTDIEPIEHFEVVIRDLVGATAARPVAVGRILDDDPRARIRGRLRFPEGMPPPDSTIEVWMVGTEGRPGSNRWVTLAPPLFEYDVAVTTGYDVAWRMDMPSPFADTLVEFGRVDADIAQDIHVAAAARVLGRVLFDDGDPLPESVVLTLDQSSVPGAAPGFVYSAEATAPDYAYAIEAVPGKIAVLRIDNPPSPFAKQEVILGQLVGDVDRDIRLRREPGASFSWYDDRERERRGEFTVYVTLWLAAPAPEGGASITLRSRDGTARAGEDYVAFETRLEFAPGASLQHLAITLLGDDIPEQDEWFGVDVTAIDGIWADLDAWQYKILNDDHVRRVASDADGDGRSDLAWHSVFDQRIESWALDGAPRPVNAFATPGWLDVTATGDTNRDGVMDAIWVDAREGQVRFWESYYFAYDRAFNFGEGWMTHPGGDWRLVAMADSDGDGGDELVWEDASSGQVMWWYVTGTRNGSRDQRGLPQGYTVATAGDLDGNGTDDLVLVGKTDGREASYWRGLPSGGFDTAPQVIGTLPSAPWNLVGAHDIDGDGRDDLAWHDPVEGVLQWWLMDGTTRLGEGRQAIDPMYRIAAIGHYDGDGRIDVVWRDVTRSELWMWRGGTDGFEASAIGAHPGGDDTVVQGGLSDVVTGGGGAGGVLHAGDFDADGRTDLGWFNPSFGQFDWWHMERATRAGLWGVTLPSGRTVLGTGDFDGDGDADLLVRDEADGALFVDTAQPGGSPGGARLDRIPGGEWRLAGIADVEGDGRDEILWRSDRARRLFWWSLEGASVVEKGGQAIGGSWHLAATGDLDGNGRSDLVWQALDQGRVIAWLARASGFAEVVIGAWPEGATLAAARDIDGDGFADLVWHEPLAARVSWWNMRGATRLATGSASIGAGMQHVASGDFDGDGLADIAWRERGRGVDALSVWLGAPGGFEASSVADYPARPLASPSAVEGPVQR